MLWDIPATVTAVTTLVNKFVPDRDQQIKIQAELQTLMLNQQQEQLTAQSDIDKTEAASPNLFIAGWRPLCGWIGAFGLAWAFLLQPTIMWILAIAGSKATLPQIDSESLLNLVLALLGLAGWRSLDKIKGVATTSIGKATGK